MRAVCTASYVVLLWHSAVALQQAASAARPRPASRWASVSMSMSTPAPSMDRRHMLLGASALLAGTPAYALRSGKPTEPPSRIVLKVETRSRAVTPPKPGVTSQISHPPVLDDSLSDADRAAAESLLSGETKSAPRKAVDILPDMPSVSLPSLPKGEEKEAKAPKEVSELSQAVI